MKLRNKLSYKSLFLIWIVSMVLFYIIVYFADFNFIDDGDLVGFLLLDILFGVIVFLWLIRSFIKTLSSKKDTDKDSVRTYFSATIMLCILFFALLQKMPSADSKTDSSNNIQESNVGEFEKCYLDASNEVWVMVENNDSCDQKVKEYQLLEPTMKPSAQPTLIPTSKKNEVSSEDLWKVEKIDEKTTDTRFPADDRMGTSEELFIAINNYRSAHAISQVQKHDTLCRIAQTRANQLLELGELDYHAGMDSLAHSQQDFNNMAEVISGGTQNELAVHTVEWGWGRSLTGHRESILDSKWTHGCGGVAGLFSVFVFGNN